MEYGPQIGLAEALASFPTQGTSRTAEIAGKANSGDSSPMPEIFQTPIFTSFRQSPNRQFVACLASKLLSRVWAYASASVCACARIHPDTPTAVWAHTCGRMGTGDFQTSSAGNRRGSDVSR